MIDVCYFIYFDLLFYLDITFWMAGKTLEAVMYIVPAESHLIVVPLQGQSENYLLEIMF